MRAQSFLDPRTNFVGSPPPPFSQVSREAGREGGALRRWEELAVGSAALVMLPVFEVAVKLVAPPCYTGLDLSLIHI